MSDILNRVRSYHKDVRVQARRKQREHKKEVSRDEALLRKLRPLIKKELKKLNNKKVENYILKVDQLHDTANIKERWRVSATGPIAGGSFYVGAGAWHIHFEGDPDGYPAEDRWAHGILMSRGDVRNDKNTEFSVSTTDVESFKKSWNEFLEDLIVELRHITTFPTRWSNY